MLEHNPDLPNLMSGKLASFHGATSRKHLNLCIQKEKPMCSAKLMREFTEYCNINLMTGRRDLSPAILFTTNVKVTINGQDCRFDCVPH